MADYKYWIALQQVHGMGPAHLKSLFELLNSKGLSLLDIFDLSADEVKGEFSLNNKIIDALETAKKRLPEIEEVYFELIDSGISIIMFFEDSYPPRLIELLENNYPPILYSYGSKDVLQNRGAAILGDSEVSNKGDLISYMAAKELSKHKIPVISGMARGAQQTAHRSALENRGTTVAVLPQGILHLKIPESLKELYDPNRMLVLSPFYPKREFSLFNAYNRNRIICAMSYAAYIIESPSEGGIFEAGKSAEKAGIPLFVTEYGNYPKTAEGNIKLIKEHGATPVRGRLEKDLLVPNMDKIIGMVKFAD